MPPAREHWAFPDGFLWGTATSSHQVEGDNKNNNWWAWEHEAGRIQDGDRSGKACDWWGGRWAEDFDRAAEAGQNTHRLSIEWSRIQPTPDTWDTTAVAFYREMLQGAQRRGLKPLVTLHHFTDPLWMAERGGWLNPESPRWFGKFVTKAAEALGDLCDTWVTINEPNVLAYEGFSAGRFPPGGRSIGQALRAMLHLTQAHAAAYHALRQERPEAQIGIAHHIRGMEPLRPGNPLDRVVASVRRRIFNDAIARAAVDGKLRLPGRTLSVPEAAGTQDFLGLNYYTTEVTRFSLKCWSELLGCSGYPPEADLSPTAFAANVPAGFSRALAWAHQFGLPIYVTENGIEDPQDDFRRRYTLEHIHAMWVELARGLPIRGYYHWTLVDNFEWAHGWSLRFGLWSLEPSAQLRGRRPSVEMYQEICRRNAMDRTLVERYAPDVLSRIRTRREPPTRASERRGRHTP